MSRGAITGSLLYRFASCLHRVTMGPFADPAKRDPGNAFVEWLWERGLGDRTRPHRAHHPPPLLDLQAFSSEDKERLPHDAMEGGVSLIYGGRIAADDLLGEPDLLRKVGSAYAPGDIPSQPGEKGGHDE